MLTETSSRRLDEPPALKPLCVEAGLLGIERYLNRRYESTGHDEDNG